ncbi:proprotein convertase P-domain-containing protein, partial [candidate division CSSED10-310 bacterium]
MTVNLTHTATGDLSLVLIGPDATQITLSDQYGADGDDYTNTVLDDEADSPISGGSPPFTGSYQPEQALSAFDGSDLTGNWTLQVTDNNDNGESGTIEGWTITLVLNSDTLQPADSNFLWQMPTAAEAVDCDQLFPSAECQLKIEVWDEAGNPAADTSDNNFYIIQPTTTSIKTLILWHSDRLSARQGLKTRATMAEKLQELADHAR